jgi:polyferredoxin
MKLIRKSAVNILIIFISGLFLAFICQFFTRTPISRHIHITSFRYGKNPSVIRCNRGDTLYLTFSTEDTGHSFFLEEFDVDVKVSPELENVSVFSTKDPTKPALMTKEVTLIARHPGLFNYFVSRSNFRCHVWCGPMHAFEQGKIIILPNTLLFFSFGCLAGILGLWFFGFSLAWFDNTNKRWENSKGTDLIKSTALKRKVLISRWPQIIVTLLTLVLIYIVILTSVFGTKVSGRNLGVLLMWAVWLFLLVAVMTPFFGRIWCSICPLPFFGDLIQRKSTFLPLIGKTKDLNNKYSGLFLKWPVRLQNDWLKLFIFMCLATFSTTLVAVPKISGITVLMLLLIPTIMAVIWELRAFCRYVCPISVFVNPFSRMSFLALRNKSQQMCDECKPHYCQKGNSEGWACPYGLNVGEINENTDCGLCLECVRTCTFENVTLYRRPFARETGTRNLSEAWVTIAIFTIAVFYSVLYLGSSPVVRDYVNILDKKNWDLFAKYTIFLWFSVLILMPLVILGLSGTGRKIARVYVSARDVFLTNTGALLPMGLFMWIAFVIPMFFVNISFIKQSISDPFGWGWDFFGTANSPWHQFIPRFIPWIQAIMILTGFYYSLRNLRRSWQSRELTRNQVFRICLPIILFFTLAAVAMILFFTN